MIRFLRKSFRTRLLLGFLAAALLPLILSSLVINSVFLNRQEMREQAEADEQLAGVIREISRMEDSIVSAGERLSAEPRILAALKRDSLEGGDETAVYSALYEATQDLRLYASCDLYDASGRWRYSTGSTADVKPLPLNWGILNHAAKAEKPVWETGENVTDLSRPLLKAAVPVAGDGGYLVVSFYADQLRSLLGGIYGAGEELLLLDRFWRPIYCDKPELAVSLGPKLRSFFLAHGSLDHLSDGFLYSAAMHADSGMVAVLQRPQFFTRETLSLFRTITGAAVFLGFCLTLALGFLLIRSLMQPLDRLRNAMNSVTLDHLDVQVEAGEDELGELAGRFNRMTEALRTSRQQLLRNQELMVQNQKDLNETQIRMLQAQLNPHFLCNTLDTMKWMGKINQVPEVAVMSTDLADILRFAISPEEFVTLKSELEILDRYLEIQRIRQSGRLEFRKEIPEELLPARVPKMILQPLVENAVLHGLDNAENGEICVRAERVPDPERPGEELLSVTVRDNGKGLPPELTGPYRRPEGEAAKHHLGLYNVDTILKKHYGERFGLTMENAPSEEEGGAVITAELPLTLEPKGEDPLFGGSV